MGQVIGFFAKENVTWLNQQPIYIREEGSLANMFLWSAPYGIDNGLSCYEMQSLWAGLNDKEKLAIKLNNIFDAADNEINYKKSINEPLEDDFFAIGMTYNEELGDSSYDAKYIELENWTDWNTITSVLNKFERFFDSKLIEFIENKRNYERLMWDYKNLISLYSSLEAVRSNRKNPTHVALVYAPL